LARDEKEALPNEKEALPDEKEALPVIPHVRNLSGLLAVCRQN